MAQFWLSIDIDSVMEDVTAITNPLTDNQLKCLSMNLRNTRNLAAVLGTIRVHFVELCLNRMEESNMILPKQTPGHFINGPKIAIHILSNHSNDDNHNYDGDYSDDSCDNSKNSDHSNHDDESSYFVSVSVSCNGSPTGSVHARITIFTVPSRT